MKVLKNNSSSIRFEISENCIDIYINDKHAGDFTIEKEFETIVIIPNSIDIENINEARKGNYTYIINTILNSELNNDILNINEDVENIIFRSVLRTEKACNFWNKLGYSNTYDIDEHENGEQEVIEITINN